MRIDPFWVPPQHLPYQLFPIGRLVHSILKIQNILARLSHIEKPIDCPCPLMPGNHALRIQGIDRIQGTQPFLPLLYRGCFAKILVHVTVNCVARDPEPDTGHVQHGRVIRICMPDFDGAQLVAFEVEDQRAGVHCLAQLQLLTWWDLSAGEEGEPYSFKDFGLELLVHLCDCALRRKGTQARPVLAENGEAELVVAVPVGDVYVAEVFARCCCLDPAGQVFGLGDR